MSDVDGDIRLAECREQFAALAVFQTEGGLAHIEQLSGGQQNSNYLVTTSAGRRYVVRVPGLDAADHGQSADVLFTNAVAAHRIGVAPHPCFFDPISSLMVTDFVDGETLTIAALREKPELMAQVIATVRRLHTNTDITFVFSKASDFLFGYSLELMKGWRSIDEIQAACQLQELLKRWLDSLDKLACCHQDLTPANLIVDRASGEVVIIDWEWAGPGDPFCDLATLCLLSEQDEEGDSAVICAYLGISIFDVPDLAFARLRLWKIWFALRGALWARQKARRSDVGGPTGPDDDYAAFAEQDIVLFSTLVATDATRENMILLERSIPSKPLHV